MATRIFHYDKNLVVAKESGFFRDKQIANKYGQNWEILCTEREAAEAELERIVEGVPATQEEVATTSAGNEENSNAAICKRFYGKRSPADDAFASYSEFRNREILSAKGSDSYAECMTETLKKDGEFHLILLKI